MNASLRASFRTLVLRAVFLNHIGQSGGCGLAKSAIARVCLKSA
jgi:hypothetical protein